MNPRSSRMAFLSIWVVATAVAVVAAACSPGGGLGSVPSRAPTPAPSVAQGSPDLTPAPPATTPAPSASGSGSPATSPTPATGETTIVRAYFFLGGELGSEGLVPVLREVPRTVAVGTAAMNALLAGPTADERAQRVSSAVPDGSRLLGLRIDDGVATVDLSSEYESGGGSMSMLVRLAQVVYTLTQFPTVQSVRFEIDGSPVTVFSSEGIGLDAPVARVDYEDLLPNIYVDRPAFGAGLGNPARIVGSANVFEAQFLITLLDGAGTVIAQSPTMASCGTGCRGTFDVTVPYDVPAAGWGTLRVWDGSAKDGSPENVREYPVWLTPAT